MLSLKSMVDVEIEKGYNENTAPAKICQDIVLKAISMGPLHHNITVKGGVVMRSKTGNIRRATQDLDIDFLRYPLSDAAIDDFVAKMNCLDGIRIERFGDIEELKQQEYKGKRTRIKIQDSSGYELESKIDLGVHTKLDVSQEEYCFDISFDNGSVSLLVNSNEQMLVEKLRSLLKFGALSTRYKDLFDIYYLSKHVNHKKLHVCLDLYIFGDKQMREHNVNDAVKRVRDIFSDKLYIERLSASDKNWTGENVSTITKSIENFLKLL